MSLTETTRLEAVNTMLSCLGESPVNSLSDTATADVAACQQILDETLRELMSREWSWNTKTDQTLTVDTDDHVAVPGNWVRVDHEDHNYIKRNGFLYDKDEETDEFDADVTGLEAIVMLDWDDMPEAARRYATIRAARRFCDRFGGGRAAVSEFTAKDEQDAMLHLQEFESEQHDLNIFNNPYVNQGRRRSI